MRALRTALLLATLLLALPASAGAATLQPGFEEVTLATGLTAGSHVEWAPDGRMFATASGRLTVTMPGSTTPRTIHTVGGYIFGMAVDRDFATNGYVYLLHAIGENARLVRISVKSDNTLVNPTAPETIIIGKRPLGPCPGTGNTVDCTIQTPSNHSVGTVISDPRDGTLWVGIGDNASPGSVDPLAFRTYDETSLAGKILHVDRTGRGLPGHAFCPTNTDLSHNCTKVYALGLRNPYRFTLRANGDLVVGDAGWNSREEIDIVKGAGRNFGWPCYEGTIRTPGYSADSRCAAQYAKEGTASAAVRPIYEYVRPAAGAAVIGGPVYTGRSGYPAEYNGNIFFADYVMGWIRRLQLNASDQVIGVKDFATGAGSPTDLQLAPNGDLVYVDYASGIARRIRYVATANRAPTAKASATPTSGAAPLTVNFSSAGSSDPDGETLRYDWDFGDGSAHSSAANPSHTYTDGGRNFTATLTVTDPRGASDTETVVISPGNTAPAITITAPSTFRGGQGIALSGSATDAQDGNLGPSSFRWNVRLIHITHEHPVSTPAGVASTSFTAQPDHDADSHYLVTLTATDSRGASASRTVRIDPETRQFTLASSPAGAPVTYAGNSLTAPFSKQSAVGFQTSVSAAETFTSGGKTYEFVSWSDGGARLHDITIPAADTTLTATYRETTPAGTEDKALGRPATSSSVKPGTGWDAGMAVDGLSTTRWSSAWGVDNQWWQVDLGSSRQVSSVKINWFTSYATRYLISTSTDGTTFTQAADVTNGAAGARTTSFSARAARYVRITGITRAVPEYGISFWDVNVFGPSDVLPPPPPPPPPPGGDVDLALNKPVSSTSNAPTWEAWRGNDGNSTTRWRARMLDTAPAWTVDLAAARTVGRVAINWHAGYASNYRISTSTDGVTYTTAATVSNAAAGLKTTTFTPRSARFVRISNTTRATSEPVSFWDFRVFSG